MVSRFFKDIVTVMKSTSVRGSGGEVVKSWSSQFDIAGSFQTNNIEWSVINNQEAHRRTNTFYCDYTTSILEADRIKYDSQTYEIIGVNSPNKHHTEITLKNRST